ncbi:MAG: hypothetical protein H6636_04425 [Anaerolineales bacterium]|nr:hypothetical protein [Anaerolineales bacterium]
MTLSSISTPNPYSVAGSNAISNAVAQTGMDGDDFMLLLLTQMRHQDPLEPMDDQAMMSQFTQLNSLQQLQQINATIYSALNQPPDLSEASALIGKTIETNNGTTGMVTGVSIANGQIMLWLGDEQVPLSSVTSIQQGASNNEPVPV